MPLCKHCYFEGEGRYCYNCGEIYQPHRITIHSILHEAIHTFTHADKGILHTLKCLALHPGTMQKNYINGDRKTHQKPFSLFFICATIAAIALHFVNKSPVESQVDFDIAKEHFYKDYYVISQAVLIPLYALFTWGIFYSKNFNYAEALVLMIYALSFSLLIIIPINFLGYILRYIDEQFMELILLGLYMTWTNINFFSDKKTWLIIFKSIVLLILCYFTSYFTASLVIKSML